MGFALLNGSIHTWYLVSYCDYFDIQEWIVYTIAIVKQIKGVNEPWHGTDSEVQGGRVLLIVCSYGNIACQ